MNTNDIEELGASNADIHYEYPLDRYLVSTNIKRRDCTIYDSSNLYAFQESITTLLKVKNILVSAESSLKSISSCLIGENSSKVVHLKPPFYFDENFDRGNYIKELVNARLKGCKIIQDTKINKISNILNAGQFVINKLSRDSDRVEEIMALSRVNTDAKSNKHRIVTQNARIVEINAQKTVEIPESQCQGSALSMHILPGIDIRSQLKEQKFPALDIQPSSEYDFQRGSQNNVVIIESKYQEPIDKIIKSNLIKESVSENKPILENSEETAHRPEKIIPRADKSQNLKDTSANPYIFLNQPTKGGSHRIDDQTSKYSKRGISKYRKYGIPEIANIYNPKPKLVIAKSAYPHFYRHMLELNSSDINLQSSSEVKYHNSINQLCGKSQVTAGILKNPNKNIEYIPYSKLTIGGFKPDEIQKHFGVKINKENMSSCDTSLAEEGEKITNMAEDQGNVKDNNSTVSDSASQYSDKFATSESHSVSFEVKLNKSPKKVTIADDNLKTKLKVLKSKSNVDVYEFIHKIERKDMCTQSDNNSGIYKNTQTSPQHKNKQIIKKLIAVEESPAYDSSESANDIKKLTIGEILRMEKTISSFNKHLRLKEDFNSKNRNKVEESNFFTRETQTSPSETAFVIQSEIQSINDHISSKPILDKANIHTSPTSSRSNKNSELQKPDISLNHDNSSSELKKANEKLLTFKNMAKNKNNMSSDTQTDVSRSETSETFSLGEVNLTILRKRIVRILNQTNSCSNTSSLSSSTNQNIHMDSTISSHKSEGEILQKGKNK